MGFRDCQCFRFATVPQKGTLMGLIRASHHCENRSSLHRKLYEYPFPGFAVGYAPIRCTTPCIGLALQPATRHQCLRLPLSHLLRGTWNSKGRKRTSPPAAMSRHCGPAQCVASAFQPRFAAHLPICKAWLVRESCAIALRTSRPLAQCEIVLQIGWKATGYLARVPD